MVEITPEFLKALSERVDEIHAKFYDDQEKIRQQFYKWLNGIQKFMPHLPLDQAIETAVYFFNQCYIMEQKGKESFFTLTQDERIKTLSTLLDPIKRLDISSSNPKNTSFK